MRHRYHGIEPPNRSKINISYFDICAVAFITAGTAAPFLAI